MAPSEYTGVWKLLYEWQTLTTGVLALIAASLAAWPVWRQLRSLKVQSAVVARDTLVMRVAAIESRRDATRQKMRSITAEFMARLHPYDDGTEPPDINTVWAHEAEQIADGVVAILIAHQETSLDGDRRERVQEVAGRARQPVEPRHHHHVTGRKLVEQPAKLGAVALRAARHFAEHLPGPGGGELVHLSVNALPVRGNSRVAVNHAAIMQRTNATEKDNRIKALILSFGILGIRRDLIDPAVLQGLPGWLKVISTIQTFLGIVLLFLFGLAIRNRFRMK